MFCWNPFANLRRFIRHQMEKIMATLQEVQDALAEQKTAREASDAKADAALALLKTTDEKLDELLAAGTGATPEQLDELLASIREGTTAITAQGDEAQAAIDAANASGTPP